MRRAGQDHLGTGGEGGVAAADDAAGMGVASVKGPFCPQPDSSDRATSKEPAAVITTRRGAKLE